MDIQNVVSDLRSQRARLSGAIAALEGLSQPTRRRGRPRKARIAALAPSKKRRTMSAAARKRISAAMKKRWATWKGRSAPKAAKAAPMKSIGRRALSQPPGRNYQNWRRHVGRNGRKLNPRRDFGKI